MGQSSSKPCSTLLRRRSTRSAASMASSDELLPPPDLPPSLDLTSFLPDDCLALVFHSLPPSDRKRCSLVCRRWLFVEAQSRHRLSLDARSPLLDALPALLSRFHSVTKLALKCDRRSESIADDALSIVSIRCPLLTRLKLRACRQVTDLGMASLAANCRNLRKLSCGSCAFGAKGIAVVVAGCPLLEELSIKRLRGLTDTDAAPIVPAATLLSAASASRSSTMASALPLSLSGSPNLKTLKLFRCSGDWDEVIEDIARKVPGLVEVHLEKLQVSDRGLEALVGCMDLEILHLVKTPECTDKGLSLVAERCRLLRKIHIDGWKTNRIGDVGLSAVALRCPNLQELVLIGVNPTSLSLTLIAENCKNLERLALCSSETFGDAEISCIASKCVALKKLCIKGCPVSDQGMEALAGGCPNLVKVKVKKCRGVTMEGADWLRSSRGSLAVNLDMESQEVIEQLDASASESGMQENGMDQIAALADHVPLTDMPSSSNAATSKRGRRFSARRNFVASAFWKWYHSSSGHQPSS